MSYEKQTLFGLFSKLHFGKHKGKSIACIYSGDASAVIRDFMKLLDKSLALIFSKELYEVENNSEAMTPNKLASGWADDDKRINLEYLRKFILAIRKGMKFEYIISSNKIKVQAKEANGELDTILSSIGCEIAKEYVTRYFGKAILDDGTNFGRPALIRSLEVNELESEINESEGSPSYIHWCIRKIDWFCLRGSENEIYGLNELPIFSLDNFRIEAGETKNSEFEIKLIINVGFQEVSKEIVSINFAKFESFMEEINDSSHSQDDSDNDDDDEYYGDNDEDNIMRGLASGDGDKFGF